MSDLQKSFAKAKLGKLPPEPPPIWNEPAQHPPNSPSSMHDHDDDSSSTSSVSSAGTVTPSPTQHLFARPGRGYVPILCYNQSQTDAPAIKPLIRPILTNVERSSSSTSATRPWTDFFAQELSLYHEDPLDKELQVTHHVYITPPTESGPLFVLHHGAGSSGLTFAVCADEIRKILPSAGILSPDCREHGGTIVKRNGDEAEPDLRLETLSRDLMFVINETKARMGWENLPDIVLVGHSLGGAVVTDVAKKGELGAKLLAYAVLDVVEGIILRNRFLPIIIYVNSLLGSAMDALQSMDKYLSARPTRFPSLISAIEWQYVFPFAPRFCHSTNSTNMTIKQLPLAHN